MKKLTVFLILAITLLMGSYAVAEQSVISPEHPLYQLRRAAELGSENLAPNELVRSEIMVLNAGRRAAEARNISEVNERRAMELSEEYSEKMEEVKKLGERISENARKQDFEALVANATQHHAEILSQVRGRVSENAREAIDRALNNSMMGHQRALKKLEEHTGEIPEHINIQERVPEHVRDNIGTEDRNGEENDEQEGENDKKEEPVDNGGEENQTTEN